MTSFEDFPPGPLDFYRKKASFDWKKMKLFIHSKEELEFLNQAHKHLEKYPEFLPDDRPLNFDEERYKTFRQCAIIRGNPGILFDHHYIKFFDFFPAAQVKLGMGVTAFNEVLDILGNDYLKHIIKDVEDGKIIGCFDLTEIGHGSNVKGIRTTATYDKTTDEFIIDTPTFEAAKCWAGGLGNGATAALFFAQLFVGDKNYGPHCFYAPIRDPKTQIPYTGVTVGDMGEKIGLNGIDNGFLMFKNYRVPRKFLLDKTGGVDADGKYVTRIENSGQRFGVLLLALSSTRSSVIIGAETLGGQALTIAIRYSGVRKQFGPGEQEIPILEYQTQQYRLLPYLAANYAFKIFSRDLNAKFNEYQKTVKQGNIEDYSSYMGIELHVMTSAVKPLATWTMRDAIQSSREACGGHGYLKAAGIGQLRSDQDASVTYEGENWVLIQQVGNVLLKIWPDIIAGAELAFPFGSIDFLKDANDLLAKFKFTANNFDDLFQNSVILNIYKWLVCFLTKQTYEKDEELRKRGMDKFTARNNVQVFYGRKLGTAFGVHLVLNKFDEKIRSCSEPSLKPVLQNIFLLYGLYSLQQYSSILYQGGLITGDKIGVLIQDAVTELCFRLKNDAVALVDAIAPPDFILNSVLGSSDGQVYQRLEKSLFVSPYGIRRPDWWRDIVNWKQIAIPPSASKL